MVRGEAGILEEACGRMRVKTFKINKHLNLRTYFTSKILHPLSPAESALNLYLYPCRNLKKIPRKAVAAELALYTILYLCIISNYAAYDLYGS